MKHRAYKRLLVDKKTECLVNGQRQFVVLYNLSEGGCMIETPPFATKAGDHVVIDLANFDKAHGRVVWAVDRNAGIQFQRNIHAAIVKYFGFVPDPLNFREMIPRDRFGRPLGPLPVIPGHSPH